MFNKINGGKTVTACFNITVFAEMVMKQLKDLLGDGYSISVSENRKNNGVTPVGLSISSKNERPDAGAIIYLEGYLGSYNEGDMDIGEICDDIIKVFHENMRDFDFDTGSISSFDQVKDRICCKLVNAEMNSDKIYMLPHRKFRDLAIIYYIPLRVNGYNASITITPNLLELWGVDEADLYDAAMNNNTEYCILSIAEVMKDAAAELGLNGADSFFAAPPHMGPEMYVATNKAREFGATFLMQKNRLKEFSDKINDDFYILPSSVHELLFIPATGMYASSLSEMVKDVNENLLDKEEILSNSVYRYYRDLNKVIVECYG